eukprot:857225-Rhodomonas_salina.2
MQPQGPLHDSSNCKLVYACRPRPHCRRPDSPQQLEAVFIFTSAPAPRVSEVVDWQQFVDGARLAARPRTLAAADTCHRPRHPLAA